MSLGLGQSATELLPMCLLKSTWGDTPVVLVFNLPTSAPCPTHVELHFCIAVAAFDTELPKLGQHSQKLPLALVHEDALVELHLFWQAPQGDVNVLD